jgi:hypothetical protein
MIIESVRAHYGRLAAERKERGNPTGSQLGTCTASLQFRRFPEQSNPEALQPRDLIRFAHGRIEEEWLNDVFRQCIPNLTGLRQEPFYFPVPLKDEELRIMIDMVSRRRIWGIRRDTFSPPYVRLVDGRLKMKLIACPSCDAGISRDDRPAHGWCGKMLGFVVDSVGSRVWVPTFVDWLGLIDGRLVVIENKSMSNFGFRDVLLGRLGWGRLAQMIGLSEATGLDVVMIAERKETSHLVELDFSRRHQRKVLTITKLTGKTEEYMLKDDREPELPGDQEWDLAHVDNPYDDGMLTLIHDHVRRTLLFSRDAGPGSKDVFRQYGPVFDCPTCGGSGIQRTRKGSMIPLARGPKACEECNSTGKLDRAELGYPCSYCVVKRTCYPMVTAEFDSKPHFFIDRAEFEASGITFEPTLRA